MNAARWKTKNRGKLSPILSVNVSLYWDGGAHPGHLARISTVNLDKDKTPFLLTDIFPEDQILSALLNDKVVKKALRNKKPRNLAELIHVADGGCEISFYSLKESFAFHHIKGNNVAIRIGLPHGCEVMRGNYTELGIYLPIPANLRSLLEQAEKQKTLMKKIGHPSFVMPQMHNPDEKSAQTNHFARQDQARYK